MTDVNRKANAEFQRDLIRYFTSLRAMDKLGVLDEVADYVRKTPTNVSKYGEMGVVDRRDGGSIFGRLAADIKAGTVSIPVLAAVFRMQYARFESFYMTHRLSVVSSYITTCREPIRQHYLRNPEVTP